MLPLLLGVKWYPVLFNTPMNAARAVFFWLAVALAIAFLFGILLIKGERRKPFLKGSFVAACCFAGVVAVTLLTLGFLEDGIVTLLFVPVLLFVVSLLAGAITLSFVKNRTVFLIVGCIAGAALIATLVCTGVYYAREISEDGYYNSDTASVNQLILYLSALVLLGAIVAAGFLLGREDRRGFDSKSISYAAVCVALSFALSYLRIWRMPQGGSITAASLLPLMIYSYMFGTRKGVFAGLAYGILQAFQGLDNIIHPAQLLLDFPIAFAAIGLSGSFADVKKLNKLPQIQFALGAVCASGLRFLAHLLSGVFAFAAYAEGVNPWIYSAVYNSYVFIDIAISVAVGVAVFSSPAFMKQARKFRRGKETPAPPAEPAQNTEVK